MKELLRMIFHIPEPDGHPKGDARFIFRRKKERQFLRNFLGGFVIACMLLLGGTGVAIKQISDKLDTAYVAIQELVDRQREGQRFTAGNGWQMSQLALSGEVDMTYFPNNDLKDPSKTWFHGWLLHHGFLVEMEPEE